MSACLAAGNGATTWRRPGTALLVLGVLATAGCREGPAEFVLERPEVTSDSGGQLTLNVRDDRMPSWNGSSDSVLFTAESYPPYRDTKGLLLAISRTGGVVRPLVEVVQFGPPTQPWLLAPALSPSRERIAFIELTDTVERPVPASTVPSGAESLLCPQGTDLNLSAPILRAGRLRVRAVDGGAPDQAVLPIAFEGVSDDSTQHPFGLPLITIEVSHPFQRQFERDRTAIFRPAWSPDGTRVAFSDGLSIRIWTPGQPQTVLLPGSEDGILPAWSPDGSRIAYTRLERGQARTFDCIHFFRDIVVGYYRRIVYGNPARTGTAVISGVDGSGIVELGEGYAPAWTRDGSQLIVERAGSLWRLPVNGPAPVAVPQTNRAWEPAISPDGNWLAFARQDPDAEGRDPSGRITSDLWVVPLR